MYRHPPNVPTGGDKKMQRNSKKRVTREGSGTGKMEKTKSKMSQSSSSEEKTIHETTGAPRRDIQSLLEKPFSLRDVKVENNHSNTSPAQSPSLGCSHCSSHGVTSSLNRPVNEGDHPDYGLAKNSARKLPTAKVGKPAPDFSTVAVVDGEFKTVKLADFKGKYVVLFFWPRDFTFVCPTEIIAFSDRAAEFRKINCEIIGCSTDSQFTHFAWYTLTDTSSNLSHMHKYCTIPRIQQPRKEGGLGDMDIPLLSDSSHRIARDYGVLKEDEGLAYRGLFIIDGKGILRQITINDLPVGRDVDETMRLVQAFQYTDAHGEVCPAGWRPGKATIKPGMREAKEFFEKATQ